MNERLPDRERDLCGDAGLQTRAAPGFSSLWEQFLVAKAVFEDALCDVLGGDHEKIGHDPYDNSLEIYGAEDHVRLTEAAQRLIFSAGFRKIYVNHLNGWQTHYTWKKWNEPFTVVRGWRRKAKLDGSGFLISFWPESWNTSQTSNWLSSGYVVIEPDPLEADAREHSSPRQVSNPSPGGPEPGEKT